MRGESSLTETPEFTGNIMALTIIRWYNLKMLIPNFLLEVRMSIALKMSRLLNYLLFVLLFLNFSPSTSIGKTEAVCPGKAVLCKAAGHEPFCCNSGGCGIAYGCRDGKPLDVKPHCPPDTHACVHLGGTVSSICCVNGQEECVAAQEGLILPITSVQCVPYNLDKKKCEKKGDSWCGSSCCNKQTQYCYKDPGQKVGECKDKNEMLPKPPKPSVQSKPSDTNIPLDDQSGVSISK
jgi:hypothetical protein